jgi:heme o synthase
MPEKLRNYLRVAKPGIVLGNLISAAGGFFLGARGRIDVSLLLATLAGISLVVAAGCVLNNCIDRKIDRKMSRTCGRVLARRVISPQNAIGYALLLGLTGTVLLWGATNRLCVTLVLAGFVIYVVVYSLYLKRRSLYATLIGSLAGTAPPIAGYCAATGRFDPGAWILLLIFGLWQMPHCYAFAIYRFDDYAAAQIPVVPVRLGIPAAKRHIALYVPAFVAATAMLTVGGYTGYGYFWVAMVLGLLWLVLAWSGFRAADDGQWARRLFVFSFVSIAVLSVMMSIDHAVPLRGACFFPEDHRLAWHEIGPLPEHPGEPGWAGIGGGRRIAWPSPD